METGDFKAFQTCMNVMMVDLPRRLTIPRVADELGVTPRHVYNLIKEGCFEVVKVGYGTKRTAMRVTRESFCDFVEKRTCKISCEYKEMED